MTDINTDTLLDIQECKNVVALELVTSVNMMKRSITESNIIRHRKEAAELASILLGLKSIY